MPQIINTNVASLTAQRNLNSSQNSLATSLQRLSSGLRINSARDDAAGLAISQRMNAQVKGLNQAARNASDGISMIQTAEGGMSQIQDMLIRMKELATQGSNSTLADAERSFISDEMTQLRDEINNISTRTKFNGQQLLNGSFGKALDTTSTVQVGMNLATTAQAAVTKVDISGAAAGTTFTFANAAGVLTLSDGTNSQAIDLTAVTVAAGGSYELNFNQLGVKVNVSAAASKAGADIATDLDAGTIITTAATGAEIQVGADDAADNRLTLTFGDTRIGATSSDARMVALNTDLTAFAGATTAANSQKLLTSVENALTYVSEQRAGLGAQQNRLDYTVANLQTQAENITASKSRITDADFAAETANLTRAQILQQAGTAMLAQANSLPQNVLSLLRG
ncbi:MAG: flagellin [Methyloversatilis sp.]|jgi:flagellin|uniref:Flagellin n=1 Tax=Methyloversatilis universalis (strain ATCC BAA-1314 / DSM 25237 / JCM 13912 / CCUG 52030 / FAM5) TaxID=1000565 RepID=F5R7V6_METUF|nr:flagellin [Methyloversatilis universalis]EGK73167.1 Flagellin [Methyloversatilis universalis FAM5]MCP4636914.1 flagellin [Methyloversatilis sp.]